ncbi:MAG: site-specific recombinase [Clostridiales bacterium]|jgi:DNA invertase Pin-like site-specific DNA recombinase|nr:site-specific recombinase [Clostridiales bacterium]MDK2991425.1 site-specific recombinase [Clostridiales bacterium]
MTPAKRVACLYRVSTKKQLDDTHIQDIPMQRKACMEFIDKHDGWQLVKEYTEPGISGYKTKTDNREQLIQAKHDAENGLFDILLVYMFDRLGRRQEETPFVLEYFDKLGIEVWSVVEGQQKFEQHVDSLINFIRFWQAEGESKKTSVRVDTKHRQMVQDGQYRGGQAPFGYKTVPSGKYNKDGKELLKLVINEDEAEIVKLIFHLYTDLGYGIARVTNYLIEHGYNDKSWARSTIDYMVRNPIYAGYMCYAKTTRKDGVTKCVDESDWLISNTQNPELAIISKETFDKAQLIRKSRDYNKQKKYQVNTPTKSPLLLTGFIYCGYCGGALTSKVKQINYTTKNGEVHRRCKLSYRCTTKLNKGASVCEGPTTYSRNRIEGAVLQEVFNYINKLKNIEPSQNDNLFEENIKKIDHQIDALNKQNKKNYEILTKLRREIGLALIGESKFDTDTLSQAIKDKEDDIKNVQTQLDKLYPELEYQQNKLNSLEDFAQIAYTWEDKFNMVDVEHKKAMLAVIIDKVVVYRDKIDVILNLDIEKYMQTVGVLNTTSCTPN